MRLSRGLAIARPRVTRIGPRWSRFAAEADCFSVCAFFAQTQLIENHRKPSQPRRGVMGETPGEAWGLCRSFFYSLEEAECEQDAYTTIHIRPLRGRISERYPPPRLCLGLFTLGLFEAGL